MAMINGGEVRRVEGSKWHQQTCPRWQAQRCFSSKVRGPSWLEAKKYFSNDERLATKLLQLHVILISNSVMDDDTAHFLLFLIWQ